MKIIHTSDWHLGGSLHDQDRHLEHESFIQWLENLMREEKPAALIVAGDVFDTCAPSNRALNLYYALLAAIHGEKLCRTVIVIGGNHDSPTLLDAPGQVLAHLNTEVRGEPDAKAPGRSVVVVPGADNKPGLAVVAVPYPRPGTLGEPADGEAEAPIRSRFRRSLAEYCTRGLEEARAKVGADVPVVMTAHLFMDEARISDDRSERIGNLEAVPLCEMPRSDYFALGHLHIPQQVGTGDWCRYSGSPLPMSFGEAGHEKSVTIVEFGRGPDGQTTVDVRPVAVPCFQALKIVSGDQATVNKQLRELVASGNSVWVAVHLTAGEGSATAFWNSLPALVEGSRVRILVRHDSRALTQGADARTLVAAPELKSLTPAEVFHMRLLDTPEIPDVEREPLLKLFNEVVIELKEADVGQAYSWNGKEKS